MFSQTLGFIGAGHMSSAIIAGLIAEKHFPNIIASCKSKATAERISSNYKIKCFTDNSTLLKTADCLIIGVKPGQLEGLLREMAQQDLSDKLIITLVAGIPLESYRRILGDEVALVRAIPNMAAQQQAALTGIYCDEDELNEEEEALVDGLFASVGGTEWLEDETQIDGIIALAGSGIGLVFRLMQAMANAGERYGFTPEQLYDIVSQTFFGAAVLALEEEGQPSFETFLKRIATPNGTTAAGLKILNDGRLDVLLEEALQATVLRSQALGEELSKDW